MIPFRSRLSRREKMASYDPHNLEPEPRPVPLSAAEQELKRRGRRRLIGAVTLGLVALVVLPMIFDSEPKGSADPTGGKLAKQEIAIQIPSKQDLAPLPPPVVAPPAAVAVPTKAEIVPPPVVETPKPVESPPAVAAPSTDTKAAFVVQLGAFSDAGNAK